MTTEKFIINANHIHNNKYDYSKTEYISEKKNIIIICKEHGEFSTRPARHLKGSKCPRCVHNSQKITQDEFLEQANKVHKNKYDYSKAKYEGANKKLIIICPKHGEFLQTPSQHINSKNGCPLCAGNLKKSTKEFITKAKNIHGDRYIYSKSIYQNNKRKLIIVCPKHGEFLLSPKYHLNGRGCPECSKEHVAVQKKKHFSDRFKKLSTEIHRDKYDYSKSIYNDYRSKVAIDCPNHGIFFQTPQNHIRGSDCPKCNSMISSGHQEIIDIISNNGIDLIINDREQLTPLELDIFVPKFNLGIEIDGEYFHGINSSNYLRSAEIKNKHLNKFNYSKKNKINLLQFWSTEIDEKKDIVRSIILNKLMISNRIYARNCIIGSVAKDVASDFFIANHLQGNRGHSINYCLFYDDMIVAMISFSRHKTCEWEVMRYANKLGYTVVGGLSRLMMAFIRNQSPKIILTYSDNRIGGGDSYQKIGFKRIGITKPNYFYYKGSIRLSRQQCQKKKILHLTKDHSLSESEIMIMNGWSKVYDSGHSKYLWSIY